MSLPWRSCWCVGAAMLLIAGCRREHKGEQPSPNDPPNKPAAQTPKSSAGNLPPRPAPPRTRATQPGPASPKPEPASASTAPDTALDLPDDSSDADATTQPAEPPPAELAAMAALPAPALRQFAVYRVTTAGPQGRLKQVIQSMGPGPNDVTIGEQLFVGADPVGQPNQLILPLTGRRWPRPMADDLRTVRYGQERIDAAGRPFDCIVLTVESRSGGSLTVEKQWFSAAAPVTHLVRLIVTTDGREVSRQELIEFGPAPSP